MEITVEIPDEFAALAAARGLGAKSYVESLIAEQVASLQAAGQAVNLSEGLSLQEFESSLDALAQYSDKIPTFPISAFARESFYEGHD
jgi:hypothetical protein